MRIAIGSDHAGFALKQQILGLLQEMGVEYHDLGTYDPQPCDYPDVARRVAEEVAAGSYQRGIIVCGTGVGSCMVANKMRGIRAALCHDTFSARMSRQHNDANVLCLGERVVGVGLALEVVRAWLQAPFCGEERHQRRLAKMALLDSQR